MFALLGLILPFLTGLAGPASNLINNITELKKMRAKAESDKELREIDQLIQEAHDRKAVLVAEAGNRIAGLLNASMRIVLAIPAAAILWKLAYDKIGGSYFGCRGVIPRGMTNFCKQFGTDSLGSELAFLITAVIGFFFLTTWKRK